MENQQNLLPENVEAPAPKGWDSVLYGLPDGDSPRRPGDEPRPLITGSGLPFRWQGFLIYFFMWIYGAILILNAIPVLNGSIAEESLMALAVRYLPNMSGFMTATGVALIVLGAAMIVTRFLLARYLRCALPVFFVLSAADILLPLLFPLGMYAAMQPLPYSLTWWEMYSLYLMPEFHRYLLYPLMIRLILLICHSIYYYRRRSDFSN